jgi:hypothetical protein
MTELDFKSIRSLASRHRRSIFKSLLSLPHDHKYLGYLLTKKAKDLGLVSEDRKNLKGNTVVEWSESVETDGRNTPNAWACTAAIHVLLEYGRKVPLSEDELIAFAFYLTPDNLDEDSFFQAKSLITNSLIPAN